MHHVQRTLCKVALLAGLVFARPAAADDADEHFAKGRTAFNAGKFEEALREFQAAWTSRKTHDLAASMAQAEMQLGRYPGVAEHLTYALQHFPVSAKEDLRKKMEAALSDAKARVATFKIQVNVDGAEVLVDGTGVGRAPLVRFLLTPRVTPCEPTNTSLSSSSAPGCCRS